jgi:ABC-type taurine transport system ATPase subunit
MKPILTIRGVERRFGGTGGGTLALQSTDLDVAENDFVTILGPSGCGKSTLLRIVAGLDQPTAGEVQLDGRRIEGPGADRGMVFQSYTLFPWLNVLDNVCFGLRERGMPRAQQLEIAVAQALKVSQLRRENASLRREVMGLRQNHQILGDSPALKRALTEGKRKDGTEMKAPMSFVTRYGAKYTDA